MKKVLLTLILSFCFMVPFVSAQGNHWDKRVFQEESGFAYNTFIAKNAKWIDNSEIPARLLGILACKDPKNQDYLKKYLSPENQKDDNCVTAFVAFNSLGVYDKKSETFTPKEKISLTDFKKIGQKEGFWLPYEPEIVQNEALRMSDDKGSKKVELPVSFAE